MACITRKYRLIISITLLLSALTMTHFYFLPHILGYYQEDCYISKTEYEGYKKLFQAIITAYEKLGQIYWVDHGLLLGYHRLRDMLPYDGDLDISRMHAVAGEYQFDRKFKKLMAAYRETYGNSMVAEMNYTGDYGKRVHLVADLFRYQIKMVDGTKMVAPYWNRYIKDSTR